MSITVRIPTPLRKFTGGSGEVDVTGATVAEALESLTTTHADLKKHLLDDSGEIRNFVNVFVGDTSIRELDGSGTPVPAGTVISLIPAVAGGRP